MKSLKQKHGDYNLTRNPTDCTYLVKDPSTHNLRTRIFLLAVWDLLFKVFLVFKTVKVKRYDIS